MGLIDWLIVVIPVAFVLESGFIQKNMFAVSQISLRQAVYAGVMSFVPATLLMLYQSLLW